MIKSVKFVTYKSQKLRKNQQIFTFEKVVFLTFLLHELVLILN